MAASEVSAENDAMWTLLCAEADKTRSKAALERAEAEFVRSAERHRRALMRCHELKIDRS